MLDEFREYCEYTAGFEGASKPRLKTKPFNNNDRSGMKRALWIIARAFLFHFAGEEEDARRIDIARNALKSWCGLSCDRALVGEYDAEISRIRGRLNEYMWHCIARSCFKKLAREDTDLARRLMAIPSGAARGDITLMLWELSHLLPKRSEPYKGTMKTLKNLGDNYRTISDSERNYMLPLFPGESGQSEKKEHMEELPGGGVCVRFITKKLYDILNSYDLRTLALHFLLVCEEDPFRDVRKGKEELNAKEKADLLTLTLLALFRGAQGIPLEAGEAEGALADCLEAWYSGRGGGKRIGFTGERGDNGALAEEDRAGELRLSPGWLSRFRMVPAERVYSLPLEEYRKLFGSAYVCRFLIELTRASSASRLEYNAISFDRVIADALDAGPLKRYYLACDDEEVFGRIKKVTETGKNTKKIEGSTRDILLKYTSAYLLSLERDPGQEGSVRLNLSDVKNWSVSTDSKYDFDDRRLYQTAQGRCRMDPAWLEHFCLIECAAGPDPGRRDEALEAYLRAHGAGASFYSDFGSAEGLRAGERYGQLPLPAGRP